MKVYFDGDHWVVAQSPEDADKVLADMMHPPKSDFPDLEFHAWTELSDDDSIGPIHYEEIEIQALEVSGELTGPASAWVQVCGRGLIGSKECCNAY